MNRQELFNKALVGVYKQGKRSVAYTLDESCLYDDGEGNKCAVGHCFTDTVPLRGNVLSISALLQISEYARKELGVEKDTDVGFLTRLQTVHDMCKFDDKETFRQAFLYGMKIFAASNKLKLDMSLLEGIE